MHHTHYHPRRTHRKRSSLSALSSDTILTLPEYTSPKQVSHLDDPPSDRPPDYPDSAEEGDADTDDGEANVVCVPQPHSPSLLASPRRARRQPTRRKSHSVSDPFLDSLLMRSVHALEMSNALLQSSMSTQSSISNILDDNRADRLAEATSALGLSTRIRGNKSKHDTWMDNLEEISKGVEGLFCDGIPEDGSAVSQSLPTSSMPNLRNRRQRSLDLRKHACDAPHLQLSRLDRVDLVAPAPRAVTLYVQSTTDPDSIILPSTLGLRVSGSSHSADLQSRGPSAKSSQQDLKSSQSLHYLPSQPVDHTTPAYTLLSTLAKRSESATPPPAPVTNTSPRVFAFRSRRGSNSTASTERGSKVSRSPSTSRMAASPDRSSRRSISPSRSVTPKPSPIVPRQMTPPLEEELPASSSESSSSSDHPTGYRTVQCLRKILDHHQSTVSLLETENNKPDKTRAPAFLPRSPPPAPSSGTSTATASISRLFTKGRHSSSTRPPSPPAQSSLKVRSVPPTPSPSPTLSLPEMFGNGVARALGSTPSSGLSTPKRISFAELPESYAKSRPEGTPSKFKDKKARSKAKKNKKGSGDGDDKDSDSGGWFATWLLGVPGTGMTVTKQEDRTARGWGNRPGCGTLDDWAV